MEMEPAPDQEPVPDPVEPDPTDPAECRICFETVMNRYPTVCIQCGHGYCRRCVIDIFNRFKKCSVCGSKIESEKELLRVRFN